MREQPCFDEDVLLRYLGKIRRISKMEDSDAIEELNEFFQSLQADMPEKVISELDSDFCTFNFDDKFIQEHIIKLKDIIKTYNSMFSSHDIDFYTSGRLHDELSYLFDMFGISEVKKCIELSVLIDEVNSLADRIEVEAYVIYINDFDNSKLVTLNSVRSVLNNLDKAESYLIQSDLMTTELEERILYIKKECAWHRAKRNIAEAEVAKGGGNDKKYNKLIGEAQVMLKQDWSRIVPDIPVPSIL